MLGMTTWVGSSLLKKRGGGGGGAKATTKKIFNVLQNTF